MRGVQGTAVSVGGRRPLCRTARRGSTLFRSLRRRAEAKDAIISHRDHRTASIRDTRSCRTRIAYPPPPPPPRPAVSRIAIAIPFRMRCRVARGRRRARRIRLRIVSTRLSGCRRRTSGLTIDRHSLASSDRSTTRRLDLRRRPRARAERRGRNGSRRVGRQTPRRASQPPRRSPPRRSIRTRAARRRWAPPQTLLGRTMSDGCSGERSHLGWRRDSGSRGSICRKGRTRGRRRIPGRRHRRRRRRSRRGRNGDAKTQQTLGVVRRETVRVSATRARRRVARHAGRARTPDVVVSGCRRRGPDVGRDVLEPRGKVRVVHQHHGRRLRPARHVRRHAAETEARLSPRALV